jgi:ABC-type transport system involved in cytochrome c biogenesis permease subunit
MATMLFAYRKGDAKLFNATLAEYETWLAAHSPSDLDESKVQYEAFFNYFAPFWWAAWLYLTAFVLVALGWLGWTVPLNRAALWLVLFTLALHTFAIISRIYISGRPPVTNLYSSAIFIGWGGVVLGIVLEMVYRLGIGTVIASVAGFVTLLIAYFLSASGDTMTVLLAVLDTQFWLATHVVCVTLGYATTYIAGLLGVLYILRGVLTPSLSPAVGKDMARMIYGTLCFAMFFSFVGTVLGGLWADDSWGRFWGWDPKENGALMIVLWNALVLHARWGGMVRERGLANLAIVGNIVVSWSYFGVNELGVGLHSYGFTEGVLLTLGLFTASQLGTIALGLIPRRLWWSSRAQPA